MATREGSPHQSEKTLSLESGNAPAAAKVAPEAPDGGLKAWMTLAGSSLLAFSTLGVINAYGSFEDYYLSDHLSTYSPTLVSMIGAIQVLVLYLMGAFVGPTFDAIGPKKLIPISGLIASFALFMLSITQPQQIYQVYLSQGLLFNFGASLGFYPAIAVVGHWFRRRIALALGIVIGASGAGGVVFPILVSKLIPVIGFGWTVRLCAFIVLGSFAAASVLVTSQRPVKSFPKSVYAFLDFSAFKNPQFTLFAIGGWFGIVSVFNPFFFIGAYNTLLHPDSTLSPYLLAIVCGSSILGRVVPGIIADKVGRFNVIFVTMLVSSILCFALWYNATTEGGSVAFAVLYGIFSGPFFSLLAACVAQISPVEKVGANIGILFAFLSFGALAGSPVAGVFIKVQTQENYRHLILYTGATAMASAIFLAAARLIKERRLWVAL